VEDCQNCVSCQQHREMFRLALVHKCVTKQAPTYLMESFQSNVAYGHRVTRGSRNYTSEGGE
jgi:hypothetical protein